MNDRPRSCTQGSTRTPRSPRRPYRSNTRCQLLFKSDKTAGILMAIPFTVCFALFGMFNLIAGSVLTSVACKRKLSQKSLLVLQRLLQENKENSGNFLDPMKVVGTILLITGSLLVLVGILLGIVACRSANFESRRRNSCGSFSNVPASSFNGPSNFNLVSSVGRQLSSRLKPKMAAVSRLSAEAASSSTKKSTAMVVADVHQSDDEVSISVNGDPRTQGSAEDSPQNLRLTAVTWSDEVASSSRSLSEATPSNTKSPLRKACSVSWAASVDLQISEPDSESVSPEPT